MPVAVRDGLEFPRAVVAAANAPEAVEQGQYSEYFEFFFRHSPCEDDVDAAVLRFLKKVFKEFKVFGLLGWPVAAW